MYSSGLKGHVNHAADPFGQSFVTELGGSSGFPVIFDGKTD
jgi:hypothetical protein